METNLEVKYPQECLGMPLRSIPSGMGGILPCALTEHDFDGKRAVICLHPDYYTDWVLLVPESQLTPNRYAVTDKMRAIIAKRLAQMPRHQLAEQLENQTKGKAA